MSITVQPRKTGETTVVKITDRITLAEVSKLRDTIRDLAGKGQNNIRLDLGEVTHLDESGVKELASGFTTVMNSGGRLELFNLTKRVRNFLQIEKLRTVFGAHEDEVSAS